jgi:hypothetical protein
MWAMFDVFSGVPNPEWSVAPALADELLATIAANPDCVSPPDRIAPVLGFRGVEIRLGEEEAARHGLPTTFRLDPGPQDASAAQFVRTLVDRLLTAEAADARWTSATELTAEVRAIVREHAGPVRWPSTIEDDGASKTLPGVDEPRILGALRYEALGWDPTKWNVSPTQQRNNCYCFGADKVPNYFGVPGFGSGVPVSRPFTCDQVTKALLRDGMTLQGHGQPANRRNRNLMAMVLGYREPIGYTDYHFYRQLADGSWGHKGGNTPAIRTDDAGKIIWDPETCSRRNYPMFCGYFFTQHHAQVAGDWYPGINGQEERPVMTNEPTTKSAPPDESRSDDRQHPLDDRIHPAERGRSERVEIGASATDTISNVKVSTSGMTFDYALSQNPYYQFWALYRGNMPAYAYWGKYDTWNWFYNNSSSSKTGTITVTYGWGRGEIYTIALFKDSSKSTYQLADYVEFIT